MKRLFSLLALCLSFCGLLPRSMPAPVPTIRGGVAAGSELVVFLPGRWSTVDEFEREGFFKIAAERWPAARLVAADFLKKDEVLWRPVVTIGRRGGSCLGGM